MHRAAYPARICLFLHVCLLGIFPSHQFVHFPTKSFCIVLTLHFNQNLGFCTSCHVSTLIAHPLLPLIARLCDGITLCLCLTRIPFAISLHLLHYMDVNMYVSTTALTEPSMQARLDPCSCTAPLQQAHLVLINGFSPKSQGKSLVVPAKWELRLGHFSSASSSSLQLRRAAHPLHPRKGS